MKKTLAIAAVVAMVPFSAFAKQAITDSEMGKVTGQSGVSIDLDVRMDIHADTFAWGNSDGAGTTSWIGMKNFNIDNMTVKLRPDVLGAGVISTLFDGALAALGGTSAQNAAIAAYLADKTNTANSAAIKGVIDARAALIAGGQTDASVDAVLAGRGAGASTQTFIDKAKPMTIDVATTAAGTGNKSANTTYVSIGLGSLQFAADNIAFEVALGKTNGAAATNADLNQSLGFMTIKNLNVGLNGSSKVDIYSLGQKNSAAVSTNPGVVFDLNVVIDRLTASAVSWGNNGTSSSSFVSTSNGGGTSTATSGGYVGFSNLAIGNMTMVGPVSIQVGTVPTVTLAAAETAFNTVMLNPASTALQKGQALSNYYYAMYDKTGPATSQMGNSFVHFGIGTGTSTTPGSTIGGAGAFNFGIGSMTADIKVSPNADLTAGGTYGSFAMSNFQVGVNGWVNIGAH